jgi:hypothetical protein
MIKDIVINLSVHGGHDPAVDYAVSIAEVFRAHITAIAFAYDPPIIYGPAVVPALTCEKAPNRDPLLKFAKPMIFLRKGTC